MTKLLMVDLDGTIRQCKSNPEGFINYPLDQELIPNVTEALARYKDYIIVGITNQGGVAAGFKSLANAISEQQYTMQLCSQLSAIYFCPDFEGKQCLYVNEVGLVVQVHETWRKHRDLIGSFRKPSPGMLHLAIRHEAWQLVPTIPDLRNLRAMYIGDRPEDEQAAQAAGVRFMWAADWINN